MRSYKGRPVIEATDAPLTVDRALHQSVRYWSAHMPPEQAEAWPKKAADAWGAMQDGFGIMSGEIFRPAGEALLYMSTDELELALVAYGCELLDQKVPEANAEVLVIDGLLKQIDHIKPGRL